MKPNFFYSILSKILSIPKFNGKEFVRILSSSKFLKKDSLKWTEERIPFVFQIVIIYIITIFILQKVMKNYEAFKLKIPLAIWNLFLSIYSTISVYYLFNDFFEYILKYNITGSWCILGDYDEGITGYYVWLFTVSKLFELFDTLFVVLKKKPLRFIHWYHHILTLIFIFFTYIQIPAFARWGVFLNTFVHSIMYFYYFVKSLNIKVPKFIPIIITSLQIIQFIMSCCGIINITYKRLFTQDFCHTSTFILSFAAVMDFSYLFLFINFFIHNYLIKYNISKVSKKLKQN
ncbi:Elongation of very long chain fatty acids protein [Strongyloides ratti]|uniref:Elongation of very long chain fatty acids protein n=1 Tax=Strongyloides ratti TaxID=34506 RepID=A0A090LB02_STRRB|nr:Elongation of very long chain fatty acids protein [Strongyloides ratti]CEF65288.1 Elongation of very long chain fatty acids protein [Strongyloides ratti]